MATARSRSADIKLLAAATIGVLLAGFLIAGAALVATRGSKDVVCPQLTVGSAADRRKMLQSGGPIFDTGGAHCGFWLALDNNDIVAYRSSQPSGCTLKLKRDHWECGGQTVATTGLAQYPVSVQTQNQVDVIVVDLRPQTTTSSTSASHP